MIRPFIIAMWLSACWLVAAEANVDLPRYPSISPDGSQIVFSWRGDLWKVASKGGDAIRLTSHPQDDLQSAWSRDGKLIAFASTRSGTLNLHVMNADGTGLRQLIELDRPMGLAAFGTDEQGNQVVTFSARLEPEVYPSPRPFMVSLQGGEPRRVHDAYGLFPIVSPDGSKVLFNRGGAPWTRRHNRGPDTRDVWIFDRGNKSFTRLTNWAGNDGRARWIDNDQIVYASDRELNTVNLYRLKLGDRQEQARRITSFTDIDVEEFDVSADGSTLVLARWDKLYTLDLTRDGAEPVALTIRGNEDESDRILPKDISRSVSKAQLSPDGKTMAFVSYGELYVRAVEKNSPTRRVTATAARERDIAWSADGTKLYYSTDESGVDAIHEATVRLTRAEAKKQYERAQQPASTNPATEPATQPTNDPARWADAVTFETQLLITSDLGDTDPSPSPDGKYLAFRRGVGNLLVMDLATSEVRPILENWSAQLEWRWSPDARYIAYVTEDENFNSDIWIVPADGSSPAVNVTRHPDNDYAPRWSADGKLLAFLSERVNEEFDIWMVWLDKEMEALTPPELDQYYKDAAANAKKRKPPSPASQPATQPSTKPTTEPTTAPATEPTTAPATAPSTEPATQPSTQPSTQPAAKLDLDDAYLRLRRVTSFSGNESELELSPAGDKFYFVAQLGATRATWAYDRDGSEPKRIAAPVNVQHLSLAGDQLVFVDSGRGGYIKTPDGPAEFIDIADKIRIDLAAQSSQKFLEAARILGARYYDPKMNGLDWGAITRKYHELARAARTADEFDHVAAKLLGELNGSHLGINSPDEPNPQARPFGRLGVATQRVENGFRVTSILPDSPADRAATKLMVGDVITAIDFEPFEPDDTLELKLAGKTDREVVISFQRRGAELVALITPISYERLAELVYQDWRLKTARQVEEWSGGKIGYIHIRGMNQESLDVFERDLYAAAHGKQGLIIDVRNNGGGWTTDRLLASIMYPRHAYTVPRGLDPKITSGYPQDRLFIQRYTGPINMLCNERSFSNAEIISHAFKTLKRGTLVGQRTAGGVISTSSTTLIDGTVVRVPFRGWFLPDGTNMERNGAVPDILVPQTPEDETSGVDNQLKAAVEDLMKRVQ
ncbi:S41 family peptidase [Fontivita pretiosa]|uniref:S41 family peptidase n=1 Tax=Fontivita pretiosa TaxID=2989684 RepID=UPI003D177B1C